ERKPALVRSRRSGREHAATLSRQAFAADIPRNGSGGHAARLRGAYERAWRGGHRPACPRSRHGDCSRPQPGRFLDGRALRAGRGRGELLPSPGWPDYSQPPPALGWWDIGDDVVRSDPTATGNRNSHRAWRITPRDRLVHLLP